MQHFCNNQGTIQFVLNEWHLTTEVIPVRKTLMLASWLFLAAPLLAADRYAGTWNLNTEKSTGPEPATPLQMVCKDEGDGQLITLTTPTSAEKPGDSPYKSPVVQQFSLPFKGGMGKVLSGRHYTAVKVRQISEGIQDFDFMINSDIAVHVHSVLNSDGKTMEVTRVVMHGPAKPGTYIDVWEKQSEKSAR
jgi:hypothetical protein